MFLRRTGDEANAKVNLIEICLSDGIRTEVR